MTNQDGGFEDLTGQQFGLWTVIAHHQHHKRNWNHWQCKCQCGTDRVISSFSLKTQHTRSCGCRRRLTASQGGNAKHLHTINPIYHIWRKMISRCYKPTDKAYPAWGGRGIRVCGSWLSSPDAMLRDLGPRPNSRHTVERINNDGHYEPGNCRWATMKEQSRNKRNSRLLEYSGEVKTLAGWAESSGLRYDTLSHRLQSGWSIEQALTSPVKYRGPRRRELLVTVQDEPGGAA